MKAARVLLALTCLFTLAAAQQSGSSSQEKTATEKAFDITQNLYIALREIAFSGGKINEDNLKSRFLLLMPGKVLNYADYYPGKDYINFINVSRLHSCQVTLLSLFYCRIQMWCSEKL